MPRLPLKVDWDKVRQYLEAGVPTAQIARSLGYGTSTLYNKCKEDLGMPYPEFSLFHRATGEAELRLAQYKKALAGDNVMLIWLGKTRLGQKENYEISTSFSEAVRQLDPSISGTTLSSESEVEVRASILDQGCEGEQDSAEIELGSDDFAGGSAPIEADSESAPARYNDLLLPVSSRQGSMDSKS